MAKKLTKLSDWPVGELAEIVEVKEKSFFERFGLARGMSVVILKRALSSLVQFGVVQIELDEAAQEKILVARPNPL